MRRRQIVGLVTFLLLLGGCDPEKDTLAIFTKQGLTLLKPARDYIVLGGFFVVPSSGTTVYVDPFDSLSGSDGTATKFRAVVLQESKKKSIGLGAAVSTLGGLVPIPAGLQFSNSASVELAQIDTAGKRYTSPMMDALIKKQNTNKAIKDRLVPGTRIFVVQEVYNAKSLSVKSSSGTQLAGAVMGTPQIKSCSTTDSTTSSNDSNDTTKPSTPPSKDKTPSAQGSTAKTTSTGKSTTGSGGATKSSSPGNTGASGPAISVQVCWSDAATLSFKTDDAIPFAVRLNEVVLQPDKTLTIKDNNFKLPNIALGGPQDVSATTFIDSSNPTVQNFEHEKH